MKLSVYFTPLGLTAQVAGKPVLVLDVLRATTSMVTALANGAKAILPAEGGDEALRLANNLSRDDVLLVGERGYKTIEGFALGNSPREMTAEAVGEMTLVMATSNGTGAVLAADSGRPVLIGSAINFSAAAAVATEEFDKAGALNILCAGHDRQFALEDAYTAGRFAEVILASRPADSVELNDGAIAAKELVRYYGDQWVSAIGASSAARRLAALGLGEDVVAATEVDKYDVVPRYFERQVRIEPRG